VLLPVLHWYSGLLEGAPPRWWVGGSRLQSPGRVLQARPGYGRHAQGTAGTPRVLER
jgi:hypothetical protein